MSRTGAEIRAARRRATWTGGRAASFEELEEKGLEFWVNAELAAKLQAMWDAIVEAWTINGKHGPPPRLQGSAFGVGRNDQAARGGAAQEDSDLM